MAIPNDPAIDIAGVLQKRLRSDANEIVKADVVGLGHGIDAAGVLQQLVVAIPHGGHPAAAASVPGIENALGCLVGDSLPKLGYIGLDHRGERFGFSFAPREHTNQTHIVECAHVRGLDLHEDRHHGDPEVLDPVVVFCMPKIAEHHQKDVGLNAKERVDARWGMPAIADLLEFAGTGSGSDIVVVALHAANGDQPVIDVQRGQDRLEETVIDGDSLHRGADHHRPLEVTRERRRFGALRDQHNPRLLVGTLCIAAPTDHRGTEIDNAVAVPLMDREGLGMSEADPVARGLPRLVRSALRDVRWLAAARDEQQ